MAMGLSLFRAVWTNPSVLVPMSKLMGLRASVSLELGFVHQAMSDFML